MLAFYPVKRQRSWPRPSGQYEINCESVTSAVITRKISFVPYSSQRTEYTIGVRGCGKLIRIWKDLDGGYSALVQGF